VAKMLRCSLVGRQGCERSELGASLGLGKVTLAWRIGNGRRLSQNPATTVRDQARSEAAVTVEEVMGFFTCDPAPSWAAPTTPKRARLYWTFFVEIARDDAWYRVGPWVRILGRIMAVEAVAFPALAKPPIGALAFLALALADDAPRSKKAVETTAATEAVQGIADRHFQLAPTSRVAAVMPELVLGDGVAHRNLSSHVLDRG
jgi:hypothetical protein